MRYFALLLSLFFSYTESIAQKSVLPDELLCAEKASHSKRIGFRSNPNVYHGYDIHYYRCVWKANPIKGSYLRGSVMAEFTVSRNSDSLGFDLLSHMLVDSIKQGNNHIPYIRKGNAVYCYKPGAWMMGSRDSVEIFYQGNPVNNGGFGYYVLDNHMTGPIIHTLSEPYGAPYWWPCKQTLNDKIDSLDIYIHTDKSLKAASNGLLISSDTINDSTRVFHWKHRYPIVTYLVAMAITNYQEYTQTASFHNRSETMPVLNYVFPQTYNEAVSDTRSIVPMIRVFDSLFGNYPFAKEKYGHAQFTWGGGMEHQTMSFMVNFSFDLMAHELAHQWFGNQVTCGSWADLWLNEGFATYLTALSYEYLKSEGEFRERMHDIRGSVTGSDDGSVYARDTLTVNQLFNGRLRYNKAAFVLHMLRYKLGDSLFYQGIRNYLNISTASYGFAVTADLKEAMETTSGMNLDTFFLRWVYGEGFPYLKINWRQKGPKVDITLEQRPSHFSVPVFEIPVPIRFKNDNRDTIIEVYMTSLTQNHTVLLPFSADTAEFDPNVWVLAKTALGGINLDRVSGGAAFYIQPNPIGNDLIIYGTNDIAKEIQLFDCTGRLIYETPDNFTHRLSESIVIPLQNLTRGTYVTRIYSKNSVTSLKFIKP